MRSLVSEFLGDSIKKRDFSSLHEGRPSRKHVGVEFDDPHDCRECMVADLAVLCRREQLSQNSGSKYDGKACRTRLETRSGKHN